MNFDSEVAPVQDAEDADIVSTDHEFEKGTTRGIYVGVPVSDPDSDSEFTAYRCNLKVELAKGQEVTYRGLVCGVQHSIRCNKIIRTGTLLPTGAVVTGLY